MKNNRVIIVVILVLLVAGLLYAVLRPYREQTSAYEDGTYRGVFIDKNNVEVNVQFELVNGTVTKAGFRWLKSSDYHLDNEQEPFKSVVDQYREALAYLEGKDLVQNLGDLYKPETIVKSEVDGYTSATIRSTKIISAIRDALNRGVYSY